MKDEELRAVVEAAMAQEEGAFEELCERKARDILYICRYLMNTVPDGEDAAQDVILYMHEHIHELRSADAFDVWMYRVIHGICGNMIKKNRRIMQIFAHTKQNMTEERNEFLPYDFAADEEKKKMLIGIIHRLPYKCKISVLMFYYQRLTYKEIAEALETTTKDIDNTMVKAKKLIRRELEKETEMKERLVKPHVVAAVPVLTQVFRAEFEELYADRAAGRLVSSSMKRIAEGGTLAGTSGGTSVKKRNPKNTAVKMGTGLVITAGAVALGMEWYAGQDDAETDQISVLQEETQGYEQMVSASDMERVIRTLEDLIGEPEAEQLRFYASDDEAAATEVQEFLDEIGMEVWESLYDRDFQEQDTLYLLERQDHRLLVITREDPERFGFVYWFTSTDRPVPESIEISISYETWENIEE